MASTPKDNCGISYFPIEFQGVNAKGFGDYADGFTPQCAAADDLDHPLGDPAEARLSAALTLLQTGACPPKHRPNPAARPPRLRRQILRQVSASSCASPRAKTA